MAQTGANRDKTIESLKRRGVADEAVQIGAHDVAHSIVNYLVEKVSRQIRDKERALFPQLLNTIPSTPGSQCSALEQDMADDMEIDEMSVSTTVTSSPQNEDNQQANPPVLQRMPYAPADFSEDTGYRNGSHGGNRTVNNANVYNDVPQLPLDYANIYNNVPPFASLADQPNSMPAGTSFSFKECPMLLLTLVKIQVVITDRTNGTGHSTMRMFTTTYLSCLLTMRTFTTTYPRYLLQVWLVSQTAC